MINLNSKFIILLFSISWILASNAIAAPSISKFSGTLKHGDLITVTGSNFGVKSQPQPLLYEDVESGKFSTWWSDTQELSVNSDPQTQRDKYSKYNAVGNLKNNTNIYWEGSKQQYESTTWFTQYWFKISGNFSFSGLNTDPFSSVKFWRVWPANAIQSPAANTYLEWKVNTGNDYTQAMVEVANDWRIESTPAANPQLYVHPGSWQNVEVEYRENSAPGVHDGILRAWVDGKQIFNLSDLNTSVIADERFKALGIVGLFNSNRPKSSVDVFCYLDDAYIDNTWARIVLGNASTWDKSTVREVQIPTKWTDNEIIFTLSGNSLDNKPSYLYVKDATGAVNQQGFPLCNNCPQPPINVNAK